MFNVFTVSLLITVLILLCAYVYLWAIATYGFFKDLGIPYEPPKLLIGNLRSHLFKQNRHQFYFVEEIYRKHEGKSFVGMFKMRKPMLMVRNPVLCQQILTKYFDKFRNRPGAPVDILSDPLSNHLINMHGDQWKSTRTQLSKAFTPTQLKLMFGVIMESVLELADKISTDSVEIIDLFAQFDLKVSGKCILGLDKSILNNPNSKYNFVFKNLFKPTLKSNSKQLLQFLFPKRSKFVETKNVSHDIYNFLDSLVREELKTNKTDKTKFLNMITNLYSQTTDNRNDLVEKSVLLSNICLFLTTGYESTSHTIAYLLYELSLHPDIQDKLRQEVMKEFSAKSYRSIVRLNYLDHVISESQRLHPVNTSLSRQCTAGFRLPGTSITLPRGTHVCIPTFAMYKDATYFPEPDRFNPDRFSEATSRMNQKMLLPFGDGPRQCLAKCYALLEIKSVVAYLITRFRFVPCSQTQVPLTFIPDKLFISPVNGIWIRFEKLD